MSNYIPQYIDHNAWITINAAIRGYPRMSVEIADTEGDILYGTPVKQEGGRSGVGMPTEAKALKLSSVRLMEMKRKCEAVGKCLSLVPEKYAPIICLRFWGVPTVDKAIEQVRKGKRVRGLPYESTYYVTVCDKVDKSPGWVMKITRSFIIAVGEELGEI